MIEYSVKCDVCGDEYTFCLPEDQPIESADLHPDIKSILELDVCTACEMIRNQTILDFFEEV